MPEFLNEDHLTVAAELIFPNVQSCCAVVVTAKGVNNLGGYHLTYITTRREFDRAMLQLKTDLGGPVDGVYLVGNVLGRPGNNRVGLDSLADLKAAIRDGLGYAFGVAYDDTGISVGTAVRAWRDAGSNQLRLAKSTPGNWAAAANVVPGAGMLAVKESIAAAMDGNPGTKLRVVRSASVPSCTINAETEIIKFNMSSL